jgi:hypothetical protein
LIRSLCEGRPVDYAAMQQEFNAFKVTLSPGKRVHRSLVSPVRSLLNDAYLRAAPERVLASVHRWSELFTLTSAGGCAGRLALLLANHRLGWCSASPHEYRAHEQTLLHMLQRCPPCGAEGTGTPVPATGTCGHVQVSVQPEVAAS